jgi:S1-C subfamily serine protease
MSLKRVIYVLFVLLVAGAAGLTGAVAGGVAVYRAVRQNQTANVAARLPALESPTATLNITPAHQSQTATLDVNTTQIQSTVEQSVKQVGPAVVTVVGSVPGQMTFFGPTGDQTVSGSGVFISNQGYILTNNHVIEQRGCGPFGRYKRDGCARGQR